VRLLIVEDGLELQWISEQIRSAFGSVEILTAQTESEFRKQLQRGLLQQIDIAIFDALLPWSTPSPDMDVPPKDVIEGGFQQAGSRCASLLTLSLPGKQLPVIVYSAAGRTDLALPPNVMYIQKDDNAKTLIRLMKSLLQGALMISNQQSVFIVHGHDVEARETVARFIEQLGLKTVILHEQANQGRTIIEKFEDHATVPYAVVLLTPDDVGGPKGDTASLKPRARQNVLLELGFFIGKLGRRNVCALHKTGVEIPSDFQGVLYLEMDLHGAWRSKLAREMRAAGLTIELEKVL
jgi:predicted nucleotide-binding protein